MSKIEDGGPAFPVSWPLPNAPEPGMTLRDWFAGQTLAEISYRIGGAYAATHAAQIAESAYAIADAMIEARKR